VIANWGDDRLPWRFWKSVYPCPMSGCWLWGGVTNAAGYGQFSVENKHRYAHRVSRSTLVGPIPDGFYIDHLCRTPHCVNPAHLEPVTPRENVLRGKTIIAANASKTHCRAGHPYTGDNLRLTPKGGRRCRECDNAGQRRRWHRAA
jgi:HNH endonuclease